MLPIVPEGRVGLGTGAGGSLVLADVDCRLTVAYVMDSIAPCPIVTPIPVAIAERVYSIASRFAGHSSPPKE